MPQFVSIDHSKYGIDLPGQTYDASTGERIIDFALGAPALVVTTCRYDEGEVCACAHVAPRAFARVGTLH